jgi:hypothetical protein
VAEVVLILQHYCTLIPTFLGKGPAEKGMHGLAETVGADLAEDQEISSLEFGKGVRAEAIEGTAEGAGESLIEETSPEPGRPNGEALARQSGPEEVVHAALEDGEADAAALLDAEDPHQVDAAGTREPSAGLEEEVAAEPVFPSEEFAQAPAEAFDVELLLVLGVGDTEAAAQIDEVQLAS